MKISIAFNIHFTMGFFYKTIFKKTNKFFEIINYEKKKIKESIILVQLL